EKQREQEGVFATDEIADVPENDRAERTHDEAGRERGEREKERHGGVSLGEKVSGDDRGEGAVNEEVVPLDECARRGGGDDFPEGAFVRGRGSWGYAHAGVRRTRTENKACGKRARGAQ